MLAGRLRVALNNATGYALDDLDNDDDDDVDDNDDDVGSSKLDQHAINTHSRMNEYKVALVRRSDSHLKNM